MDIILYVLGILAVAVGLAVSIALHEVGHLVPAKAFGVKVTQYMIGFGRTVFSRRRGETEYGVKALPLGGYISMIGMFPPKAGQAAKANGTGFFSTLVQDARDTSRDSVGAGEDDRTFFRLPVWKRVVIMLGGPAMNLLIAFVLYAVLLSGFGVQQLTTTIAGVNECVLPAGATRTACEPGDTVSPGNAAGLLPGDEILRVDGEEATSWAATTAVIQRSAGQTIPFVVRRDGAELTLQVTPIESERAVVDDSGRVVTGDDGQPVTREVGFIGIEPGTALVRQPLTAVPGAVWDNTVAVLRIIATFPVHIAGVAQAAFGGGERDPNGPIGLVGVGRLAGEIASNDAISVSDRVATIVGVMASLNVALFAFNLVPLLPLDGGHIAGALWEGLRRRLAKLFGRPDPGPVDTAKLMPVTFLVVVLLGGVFALLVFADIVNPVRLF